MEKRLLREHMRRRRDEIPTREREDKSRAIAERLWSSKWYCESAAFFVYSAIHSEVDLSIFCERAWQDRKQLYFPRVSGQHMEFYRVSSPKQLVKGHFGVMEPRPDESDLPASGDAGIRVKKSRNLQATPMLVPGLVFSTNGGRIGYGGGYYDRYLSTHPFLVPIGVCFEAQLCDGKDLCMEAHDRRMSGIVTELGIYKITFGLFEPIQT